jgi:hypothetical protein
VQDEALDFTHQNVLNVRMEAIVTQQSPVDSCVLVK